MMLGKVLPQEEKVKIPLEAESARRWVELIERCNFGGLSPGLLGRVDSFVPYRGLVVEDVEFDDFGKMMTCQDVLTRQKLDGKKSLSPQGLLEWYALAPREQSLDRLPLISPEPILVEGNRKYVICIYRGAVGRVQLSLDDYNDVCLSGCRFPYIR